MPWYEDWPEETPFILENERAPGQLSLYSYIKRGGVCVIVGQRSGSSSRPFPALGNEVRFLPRDRVCAPSIPQSVFTFAHPPHASA